MEILRNPAMMREALMPLIRRGLKVGLVATMGALHDGHMSLVKNSLMENDHTVISIFINPSQFAKNEDLDKYPRSADADISKLRASGVDTLFMPSAADMYGPGYNTFLDVGPIAAKLCGGFRPTHFRGVATIMAKLFNIVTPKRAYFGQKDYQQCRILIDMARELNMPVEVVMCPTLREADGLAMSSRNLYLSDKERLAAPVLYQALSAGADMLREANITSVEDVRGKMEELLRAEPLIEEVQYIGCYDPMTLEWLNEYNGKALLAGAIKIGATRLIDNTLLGQV